MARPLWTGSLQFGLVNVPVKVFPAVSEKRVHFHLVHDADGARIREKRVCEKDGREVPYAQVARGYELAKGQRVVFKPEELEKLTAQASRECEIEEFVDVAEVDPVYFAASYHVVPDRNAGKAYGLLAEAMRRAGKAGLGRIILRTRESLVLIRAVPEGLLMAVLHYADEVRSLKEAAGEARASSPKLTDRELKMAEQLIGSLSRPFEPERYRDHYRDRVMELVEQKARGKQVVGEAEGKPRATPVVDLVKALEESLSAGKRSSDAQHRGAKRAHPRPVRRARRRQA